MTAALVLSMRAEVELDQTPEAVHLSLGERRVPLRRLSQGVLQALRLIYQRGATHEELRDTVAAVDGGAALPRLEALLDRLFRARLLRRSVATASGSRLATAVPIATHFEVPARQLRHDQPYALSRFAFLHREQAEWNLESPMAAAKIVLHDRRCTGMLFALCSTRTVAQLAGPEEGVGEDVAAAFAELLLISGMLTEVSAAGEMEEDGDPALAPWEFHDLLMHTRIRLGRHSRPIGGTYRFAATFPPLPAVKPRMSGEVTALYQPDMEALRTHDPPFSEVLESRREYVQVTGAIHQ